MSSFRFDTLSAHRDVNELIQVLPPTLLGLLEFDFISLFLDGVIASAVGWGPP